MRSEQEREVKPRFLAKGRSVGEIKWVVTKISGTRSGERLTSRTKTAAPSPITKPLRAASKGRDACSGSSLNAVVRERERSNPVKAKG